MHAFYLGCGGAETRDFEQFLIEEHGLLGLDDWYLAEATAISADGRYIAGYGTTLNEFGDWEGIGWRVTVPEPATLVSLVCFILCSSRRRR